MNWRCSTPFQLPSPNFQLRALIPFFEGPIPSRNSLDRATYRAVDTNADGKSDMFQIGAWAQATQEAGKPVPRLGMSLWYTDPANPASSTAEVGMEGVQTAAGTPAFAGQIATPQFEYFQGMTAVTQPSGTTALPNPVYTNARVRVITDTPPTTVDVALVDELRINQAVWNSVTKTLTVSAESGAYLQTPTPVGGTAINAICSAPCSGRTGLRAAAAAAKAATACVRREGACFSMLVPPTTSVSGCTRSLERSAMR